MSSKKIYTIFLSSTYKDLKDERRVAMEAIVKTGNLPIGMEYFDSNDIEQWDYIKNEIDRADYYIIISAGKYGTIRKKDGMSWTELEYDYAKNKRIPIGRILLNDIEKKYDLDKKMAKFRNRLLGDGKNCVFYNNLDDLASKVKDTVDALIKAHQRKGYSNSYSIDFMPLRGLEAAFLSRNFLLEDCSKDMKKAKVQVDIIAFGLSFYRSNSGKLTERLLENGVSFRILTMNPESIFLEQREIEEGASHNNLKSKIYDLIDWANNLNKNRKSRTNGTVSIKGYSCMTLGFYWRVDDIIYFGPYQYSRDGTITVTYKLNRGDIFDSYTDYFESIWNNDKITQTLTNKVSNYFRNNKNKKTSKTSRMKKKINNSKRQ